MWRRGCLVGDAVVISEEKPQGEPVLAVCDDAPGPNEGTHQAHIHGEEAGAAASVALVNPGPTARGPQRQCPRVGTPAGSSSTLNSGKYVLQTQSRRTKSRRTRATDQESRSQESQYQEPQNLDLQSEESPLHRQHTSDVTTTPVMLW